MPKEIKVFSISVVDLLCCALGGTLLVCFLLIVSIGSQSTGAGAPNTFFTASAGVWVDVTDMLDDNEKKLIMNGDGPLTQQELDKVKNPKDAAVELELYWKRPNDLNSPLTAADVIYRLNKNSGADASAFIEKQSDARITSHFSTVGVQASCFRRVRVETEYRLFQALGFRWTAVKTENRLFQAFEMDISGFKVHRGWYFINLAIVKEVPKGSVGKDTAAWLKIDSSGRPGSAWFQTTPRFADKEWPAEAHADMFASLGKFDSQTQHEAKSAAQLATRPSGSPVSASMEPAARAMQSLQLPDLFLPTWPVWYPLGPGANEGPTFALCLRNNETDAWGPSFALRCKRGESIPAAARYPVIVPGCSKDSPGWYRGTLENGKIVDEFLPGFEIGKE